MSGENQQTGKMGDVVIIHDDTPRASWKMAVIDDLVVGRDGLVRAATIRSSYGTTSRPITKLYPIELNEENKVTEGTLTQCHAGNLDQPRGKDQCPQRASARRATDRMREWVQLLSAPPEDIAADTEL